MSAGSVKLCPRYKDCSVVTIPEVLDISIGGGWIFPKNSPFRRIISTYINKMKERGSYERIVNAGNNASLGPEQICEDYAGQGIGINKTISVFITLLIGGGTSIYILL